MNTTLHESGRAILDLGNCNNKGMVVAYKNDVELVSLSAYETNHVEFEFQDGDVITILEHGGVIQFNNLSIVGCSEFDTEVFKKDVYVLGKRLVIYCRNLDLIHIRC